MRINEYIDEGHGIRGGLYALKNKDLLNLYDDQLDTLYRACAGHTVGKILPVILLDVAGMLIDWT